MSNKLISPELQGVMDRCKTKLGRISSKDPSFYLHSFDEIIMNKSVSLEDYCQLSLILRGLRGNQKFSKFTSVSG